MVAKYLSYTQVSTLFRCGRQYWYRYVARKPSIMNANLLVGRAYHDTIAAAYTKKLAGDEMGSEEAGDMFSNFWDRAIADKQVIDEMGEPKIEATYIEWQGKDPGKLKDAGIKLCQRYLKDVMPQYKPIEIETRKQVEIDGITIVGYLDAIVENYTQRKIILDHKWKAKSFTDSDLNNDFQSTTYTMLTGIPYTQFHTALDQKKPRIKVDEVHRGEDDVAWVEGLIKEAHKQIQAGNFPPNGVLGWTCNIEYCNFYTECRMGWL